MLKSYSILITLILLLAIGCSTEENQKKVHNPEIARYFDILVANRDFSGVLLIGNSNEIITTYIAGYSDFENQIAHSLDSKFGIASVSKTMTAAAILQLKDDGKIQLSDTIGKYLPEFTYGDRITILNLLRHESGLQDVNYEIKERLNAEELVSQIDNDTLLFEPGTNGRYSNAGFTVLARIVETVSGLHYEEYLESKLFLPQNMVHTGDLSLMKTPEKLSRPYFPSPYPELVTSISDVNYSLFLGSGSIYSTANDLWKWGNAVKDKSQVNVFDEAYPYGWGRDSIAGKFCLNQTGMGKGFVSSLFVFPDEDIVIVLLSNIENGLWVDWTKDVAKIFFRDSSKVYYPKKRNVFSAKPGNPDQFIGFYRLNENRVVEIKNDNGNLFLHLNGDGTGHYLLPIAKGTFELRSFTGIITFKSKDSLLWKLPEAWGGQSETYMRQN